LLNKDRFVRHGHRHAGERIDRRIRGGILVAAALLEGFTMNGQTDDVSRTHDATDGRQGSHERS